MDSGHLFFFDIKDLYRALRYGIRRNTGLKKKKKRIRIPIKLKFLGVIMFIMSWALGLFFYFADQIFSEDKKIFIMDLNLALLKGIASEVKFEIKSRLEELQIFVPRVYNRVPTRVRDRWNPYQGLSERLKDELLAVTFFRSFPNGEIKRIRRYTNGTIVQKNKLSPNLPEILNSKHPLPLAEFEKNGGLLMLNRSIQTSAEGGSKDLSFLSFIFTGNFIGSESKGMIIVVDMFQDFLRKKLRDVDIAEIFLINKNGKILSHPRAEMTAKYSAIPFPHPIINRLQVVHLPREGLELNIKNEPYLVNFSVTAFEDVYAVSQIRRSEAYNALYRLRSQSAFVGLFILFASVIVSVLFAAKLTTNIQKLRKAAESIGDGKLDVELSIKSGDEIESMSDTFRWMSSRLSELMAETANQARMEGELKTARLVQSTLLKAPTIESEELSLDAYLRPASECGGDFWDAFQHDNKITVLIGDATGHGVPAALVTAVAKSCFSTLNTVYYDTPLSPSQFLETLNSIVYGTCHGQLLMTMCLIQLEIDTGKLTICNAGHESPLCLRAPKLTSDGAPSDKKKQRAEVLFARGERLGFSNNVEYQSEYFQLRPNDIVLLYTDGITEAENTDGKEWGERALKKTFAAGGTRALNLIKEEIVEKVSEHTEGTEQADDNTFVLLEWKGTKEARELAIAQREAAAETLEKEVFGPSPLEEAITSEATESVAEEPVAVEAEVEEAVSMHSEPQQETEEEASQDPMDANVEGEFKDEEKTLVSGIVSPRTENSYDETEDEIKTQIYQVAESGPEASEADQSTDVSEDDIPTQLFEISGSQAENNEAIETSVAEEQSDESGDTEDTDEMDKNEKPKVA